MKKLIVSFLTMVVVVSLCLSSCTSEIKTDRTSQTPSTVVTTQDSESTHAQQSDPTESENSRTAYPLTWTDSYGNVAVIDQEPMRLISLAPNITELIFELGAGAKLVGRTDYCNEPELALSVDSVGSIDTPSIEAIVALEPDLIIASSIFTKDSFDALIELGYTVLVFHEEYDINGVKDMILSVGEILNRKDTAEMLLDTMNKDIQKATERVKGKNQPSVYYAISFGAYGDYTAGGDTFVSQMIELAGGDNIASDISGWSYSVEKLIEKDPDVILVNEYMLEEFITTEPYCKLSAVASGRVYGINADLIERQGFRNAKGIELLVSCFYPEE